MFELQHYLSKVANRSSAQFVFACVVSNAQLAQVRADSTRKALQRSYGHQGSEDGKEAQMETEGIQAMNEANGALARLQVQAVEADAVYGDTTSRCS